MPISFRSLRFVSAPAVVNECSPQQGIGCGSAAAEGSGGAGSGGVAPFPTSGVNIVNQGQVGVFDWKLVQASSTTLFTDWLTANNFPYDSASSDAFGYYVNLNWYFVAFTITAAASDPPDGTTICGNLGPIQLAFPTDSPVIPARIVGTDGDIANNYLTWRVHILASSQMDLSTSVATVVTETLRYSGAVTADNLSTYTALSTMAAAGDRLTSMDVSFLTGSIASDLDFVPAATPADYRLSETNYVDCNGCSFRAGPGRTQVGTLALAALALLGRRLRRPRLTLRARPR